MAKKQKLITTSGERRAKHFANGGSLHEWRGGLAHTIPNKKREADRKACRGLALG